MFIKEIVKKNKGYDKVFTSYRLMESYRSVRGPRHRTIINLGKLDLDKHQRKALADRIEAIVNGQPSMLPVDNDIEALAQHYAALVIEQQLYKKPQPEPETDQADFQTVDLNSLKNSDCQTIGAEYTGLAMFQELGLDSLFANLSFSPEQIKLAALSIVGMLAFPGSERKIRIWARELSGIGELLGTDFRHLSKNALYRVADLLLQHKAEIEQHLRQKEKDLFALPEKIILYDLTNTYFEGRAKSNRKAKRGRSKEKQYGRPLVTLGLVIDEQGFPKSSRILEGNVSEPETLLQMIATLQNEQIPVDEAGTPTGSPKTRKNITVLLDAGIATDGNLKLLKHEGYDYVVVARNQPISWEDINEDALVTVKSDKQSLVEAQLFKAGGESILYCKSFAKRQKEMAMKSLFQERFEQGLKDIAVALRKKGGTKKYDKVLIRIGRLKQKYSRISHYYRIEVEQKGGLATAVSWHLEDQEEAENNFSGSYFLRTTHSDLDEKELWDLYIILNHVEDAFRSLKGDLILRPIFHQKEYRSDAHIFITLLAYHLLNSIRIKLSKHGINMRWENVRDRLRKHTVITTSVTDNSGKRIHIRNASMPGEFNMLVYEALGISPYPLPNRRTVT
jgi:transposase